MAWLCAGEKWWRRKPVAIKEDFGSAQVILSDVSFSDCLVHSLLENELSIVMPHSLEVGFLINRLLVLIDLIWISFRSNSFPILHNLHELCLSLRSVHIKSEDVRFRVLISMSEGVNLFLSMIKVTSMSVDLRVGDFIVEVSGAVTFAHVLNSDPIDRVRLKPLSIMDRRSPLRSCFVKSFLPGDSWVHINVPFIVSVALGPIRASVSLEKSSWLSPELNVSYSLIEGVGMEILGINVPVNLRLLPELIFILIFYSKPWESGVVEVVVISQLREIRNESKHKFRKHSF